MKHSGKSISRSLRRHAVSIEGTHAEGNLEARAVDEDYAEGHLEARDEDVPDRDASPDGGGDVWSITGGYIIVITYHLVSGYVC